MLKTIEVKRCPGRVQLPFMLSFEFKNGGLHSPHASFFYFHPHLQTQKKGLGIKIPDSLPAVFAFKARLCLRLSFFYYIIF